MTYKDMASLSYTVNGRDGFSYNTALRLWRTKYDDIRDFRREVITHPALKPLEELVMEVWDSIPVIQVEEAFRIHNTEERRVYFDAIGVERLFKSLEPELLDRQVIKKKRTRWDSENREYLHEFEDVYELYRIDENKLFRDSFLSDAAAIAQGGRNHVYAVRCWCTTTAREYWIYVPVEAALGVQAWEALRYPEKVKPDAIRAIAWTIRLGISKPERIYRQGDIIVAKEGPESKPLSFPAHLTKEEYLELMYSET